MYKIAQIVDTASNLPLEILEKYNIVKIPFYITFDGKEYLVQGKDISDKYQNSKITLIDTRTCTYGQGVR